MWYLKKFETMPDYENFKSGNGNTDFIEPNVSYIINDDKVNFNSYNPKIWFKIEDETHYAYPGMTFRQWVNSEEFNPKNEESGYWIVGGELMNCEDSIQFKTPGGYNEGILAWDDQGWGGEKVCADEVITEGMQVYIQYG